jgi:hypothetical protein
MMILEEAPFTSSDLETIGDGMVSAPQAGPALDRFSFEVPESQPPRAVPEQIFFVPADFRLRFRKPFLVDLAEVDHQVIARVAELDDEFGVGQYLGDALHDLGRSISEFYFSLKEIGEEQLSAHLRSVKATLGDYVEER